MKVISIEPLFSAYFSDRRFLIQIIWKPLVPITFSLPMTQVFPTEHLPYWNLAEDLNPYSLIYPEPQYEFLVL